MSLLFLSSPFILNCSFSPWESWNFPNTTHGPPLQTTWETELPKPLRLKLVRSSMKSRCCWLLPYSNSTSWNRKTTQFISYLEVGNFSWLSASYNQVFLYTLNYTPFSYMTCLYYKDYSITINILWNKVYFSDSRTNTIGKFFHEKCSKYYKMLKCYTIE